MDVSLIIINYNTKFITKECIDSIAVHTKDVIYEIILVDNASSDGSKEFFSNDNRIRYIYLNRNVGFGKANNVGYKYSTGDYIFFLNSDTILCNNAVGIFFNAMQNLGNNIACIGCMLKTVDGYIGYSYGDFISLRSLFLTIFRRITFRRSLYGKTVKGSYPFEVQVVLGADMFVRRSAINLNHGNIFDDIYFMYQEENDFQKQLHKVGLKSMIVNGPDIVHLGGASNSDGPFNIAMIRSTFMYVKKWYGKFYYYVYRILYCILYTLFFLFCPIKNPRKIN